MDLQMDLRTLNPSVEVKTEKEDGAVYGIDIAKRNDETLQIYKTDSDTLLICQAHGSRLKSKENSPHFHKTFPPVQMEQRGVSVDSMDISEAFAAKDSISTTGFQDVDEDLSNLKKFVSFKVGNLIPCLSSTDLSLAESESVPDNLGFYFGQLQAGETKRTSSTDRPLVITSSTSTDNILASCSASKENSSTYDINEKPPYHYSDLIEFALREKGMLPVSGIYEWIRENFAYFRTLDESRWKPAIRHTLTTNSSFVKAKKAHRGYLWAMVPDREKAKHFQTHSTHRNPNHWKKQKLAEYENKAHIYQRSYIPNGIQLSSNLNELSQRKIAVRAQESTNNNNCPCQSQQTHAIGSASEESTSCRNRAATGTHGKLINDNISNDTCPCTPKSQIKLSGFGFKGFSPEEPYTPFLKNSDNSPEKCHHTPYLMPSRVYMNPVPKDVALEESGLSPPGSRTVSAVSSGVSLGTPPSTVGDCDLENILPPQQSLSQTLLS